MKFVKGDNIELEITANTNITDWKIRAEFYDKSGTSVQLATANSGGSDDEIKIDDAVNGIFTITTQKGDTTEFEDDAYLEIEREDVNGKILTILQLEITMKNEKIKWESPTS